MKKHRSVYMDRVFSAQTRKVLKQFNHEAELIRVRVF